VTYTNGASVQVLAYEQGVPGASRFVTPDPGNEYAVIDVQVCAGPSAEIPYNVFGFALQMPDNRRYDPGSTVREPSLGSGTLPAGGGCTRGWVSFEVPVGQRPVFVVWDYSNFVETKWSVDG
jgi:hypothetical protein